MMSLMSVWRMLLRVFEPGRSEVGEHVPVRRRRVP